MNKLLTYLRYFYDYLKFGDFVSIFAGIRYLLTRASINHDRIIHTSIGTFFCRRNTNDFQFANYYYEWQVKKFVIGHSREFNVFIDAGACIGDFTILMANKGLRCISFEPLKSNYEVFLKNIELNKLTGKVQTYNLGLGASNRTVSFAFDPVNTGASHIVESATGNVIPAELRTFDTLVPEFGLNENDRVLIKFDVEGMEPDVVNGAAGFIRQFRELIIILEDKISGKGKIKEALDKFAVFEYGTIDEYNFYARKTGNIN